MTAVAYPPMIRPHRGRGTAPDGGALGKTIRPLSTIEVSASGHPNGERVINEKPPRHQLPDELGELSVFCWCERLIVHATPAEIKDGRTGSCGAEGCGP